MSALKREKEVLEDLIEERVQERLRVLARKKQRKKKSTLEDRSVLAVIFPWLAG